MRFWVPLGTVRDENPSPAYDKLRGHRLMALFCPGLMVSELVSESMSQGYGLAFGVHNLSSHKGPLAWFSALLSPSLKPE